MEENKKGKLSKYLVDSLDMEDDMSSGVYADLLDRNRWPEEMDEESFLEIKAYLEELIKGTENHKQAMLRFKNKQDGEIR